MRQVVAGVLVCGAFLPNDDKHEHLCVAVKLMSANDRSSLL